MMSCNVTPRGSFSDSTQDSSASSTSSCMYSEWAHKEVQSSWFIRDDSFPAQITAPGADGPRDNGSEEDELKEVSRPLREKNCGRVGKYVHVPHKEKPPQVVARRNARERRRVQAVNSAFLRLRKAVPMENNRGKRISKVKTLQFAIEYIQNLQELLRNGDCYTPSSGSYCYNVFNDFGDVLSYEDSI